MKEVAGTFGLLIIASTPDRVQGDYGHFITDWKLLLSGTALAVTGIIMVHNWQKNKQYQPEKRLWLVRIGHGIYIIAKELF